MTNDSPPPILEPLPFDPDGIVHWVKGYYHEARCGQEADGQIHPGCCGRLFKFPACYLFGTILPARICMVCDLKRQIAATRWKERRQELGKELGRMLGCSADEAIVRADLAFVTLPKPNNHTKPTRRPDLDED